MHNGVLMPIITVISLFVLFLLIWVMARYNSRANPVASNGSLMTAPGIPKRLKALTARGQLIVVDPRRTADPIREFSTDKPRHRRRRHR